MLPQWIGIVAPVVIVLAGAIAYVNSLRGVFVLDDSRSIVDNPAIRSIVPSRASLLGPPWTTFSGRPLTTLTIALNYRADGLSVGGYHAVNIGIHLLAALALFGLLRRTFRLAALKGALSPSEDLLSAIIALLWVTHPLTSSSVTYISQRTESLMALFYLLSAYCFVHGATGHRGWLVAAVACCALGMAAKEPMITAPLFILLYDRTLLAGSFKKAIRLRWWTYGAMGLTMAALLYLQMLHPHGADVSFTNTELSSLDYLKTQSKIICEYLMLCFWPSPLVLYHGWANYDVPVLRDFTQYAPWGFVVLLLLGATIASLYKSAPIGLTGALFFLVLAPSSTLLAMPTEMKAEYRMYLPLAAVVTATVLAAYAVFLKIARDMQPRAKAAIFGGFTLLIAITLILLTWNRNNDFRSLMAFWTDAAHKLPQNSAALGNLGVLELEAGQFTKANDDLHKSLQLRSINAPVRAALGKLAEYDGNTAEAIEQYRRACADAPNTADNYILLADALVAQDRRAEATEVLTSAAQRLPWQESIHCCLGVLLTRNGEESKGAGELEQAMRLSPDPARTQTQIGQMFQQFGMPDRARQHLQQAAALGSALPDTYTSMGEVLSALGNFPGALSAYRRAVAIAPNETAALNNLAWLEAACPEESCRNSIDAVLHAEKANALSESRNPLVLDTLATAYASAGQFDRAVSTLELALRIAGDPGTNADLRAMQSRLDLFRQGKPFRDAPPATNPKG